MLTNKAKAALPARHGGASSRSRYGQSQFGLDRLEGILNGSAAAPTLTRISVGVPGEVSQLCSPMLRRISKLRTGMLLRFGLDSSRFDIGKV
jgi:hypothetical protein